jgi:hypothetical protein
MLRHSDASRRVVKCSHGPPPPFHGGGKTISFPRRSLASELCQIRIIKPRSGAVESFRVRNDTFRLASGNKKGSGAPKGALSYQCPRQARLRAATAARRLSALTLAALATGFYPDGSAPEPGFPQRAAKQAFLPLRQQKVPRLSTLRADRSLCRSTGDPGPPGSGLAKEYPRAGTASRSAVTACRPERRPH